jgi:hypothetical protein
MRGILNNFNTTANFWDVNPQLRIAFNDFFDKDKSKNKQDSSRVMWYVGLIHDPDSKFKNLPLQERTSTIQGNLKIDLKLYDKLTIDDLTNRYIDLVTTPAQRQLIQWNRIMDDKTQLLKSLKYDIANWETIEKMLTGNTKMYGELERIQDMLSKEGEEGITRGNTMESASESKLI